MVKLLVLKAHRSLYGTWKLPPPKLNACPTSPFVNVTPPPRVPLFPPARSNASPSPGHQATSPAGGEMQSADHARNAGSRQKSPTAAHPKARMTMPSRLPEHMRRERRNGRTKETIFIMTFQLILHHRLRLCAPARV